MGFSDYLDNKEDELLEAINASEYEAVIVMAWERLQGRPIDTDRKANQRGISMKTYKNILNNPQTQSVGDKVALYIQKNRPSETGPARQLGSDKAGITAFWRNHGATNGTPKTDILIGTGAAALRISLKMGKSQLMSAKKEEASATFAAAALAYKGVAANDIIREILKEYKNSPDADVTYDKLGVVKKNGDDPLVQANIDFQNEIEVLIEKAFEHEDFKMEFAREAMSGFRKFGEKSMGAAEYMLVIGKGSNPKIQIHSVLDDDYVRKIAKKMTLQVNFKSTSERVKGIKTGRYQFYTATRLGIDPLGESVLVEGWLDAVANKIKGLFGKMGLFKQLGVEPDISKITNDIDFMV